MTTRTHSAHNLILVVLVVILAAELLIISLGFDAASLRRQHTINPWLLIFSQFGKLAKFLVTVIFIYLLIAKSKVRQAIQSIGERFSVKRFTLLFCCHLLAYCLLLVVTVLVFGNPEQPPTASLLMGWLAVALITILTWLFSAISASQLLAFLRSEWPALGIAISVGLLAWILSLASQSGWSLMVDYTFAVTSFLLSFYDPALLTINAATKELGLGPFIVHIAPVCSGYEGIGLITAFASLYLYLERKSLRFPLALVLIPIGITTIWLFNSLRIALLVMIGYHWSPAIAVGGFHSQAGWLTFILTSMALLWITGRFGLFKKAGAQQTSRPVLNVPVASLLPIIALLAVTMLDTALAADFNFLYPLRVIVVAAVIAWVWPTLALRPYQPAYATVLLAAVAVTILWVLLLGAQPEADQSFQAGLRQLGDWSSPWLLLRILGTTLTVPIAEELAFRGYLLCKLSRAHVTTRGELPFSLPAIVISSLAFGFLHGAWLAGTVAGLVYALVRLRTRHLGDAIACHALTNALLVLYAVATGHWSVL